MSEERTPALQLEGIVKTFGDKVAIEHVDLTIWPGEVHAICGENGAGKSTLMNILCGIHQADAGTVRLDGRTVHFTAPVESSRAGIGMVHQHFTLVPSMTVAENVFLHRQPRRFGILTDGDAMRRATAALIDEFDFALDPDDRIADLTVGQRQRVEIIKALAFDAKILILDEPTAVLTPPEVDELLEIIADLRAKGRTVVFITHKLREVMALSDRVTVVRRGRTVDTRVTSEVTDADIAQMMVGRPVFLSERRAAAEQPHDLAPALRLRDVTLRKASGVLALDHVTLDVRPGEIVGIAGVEGNGQTELAEVVAGLLEAGGQVELDGTDVSGSAPADRRDAGLAFIPEDRLDRGLSPTMSVSENLAVSNYVAFGLARRGLVTRSRLEEWAQEQIDTYDIRGATPTTPVGSLSGGNMQKVVVARELARRPKVLVVAQPTRGVDIGASEFVRRQILDAAQAGCAVLVISSELSEILALSDRIGVMFRGALVGVLDHAEATEERLGLMMNSGSEDAA